MKDTLSPTLFVFGENKRLVRKKFIGNQGTPGCRSPPKSIYLSHINCLEGATMFDRKSDYALNKRHPDSIVCKSVTDVHIYLTRADFSSEADF